MKCRGRITVSERLDFLSKKGIVIFFDTKHQATLIGNKSKLYDLVDAAIKREGK